MFSLVVHVLEIIKIDGLKGEQRLEANTLLLSLKSFDFVLSLHLMRKILAITHILSQSLQKKDENIVNAMHLVLSSKERLQNLRDGSWDDLLAEVSLFCVKHKIDVPNMEDKYIREGRPRRGAEQITNLHHYRVELFYYVIDIQLQELNNRFSEANTELLFCMASLDPSDSFKAFDKDKLIRLVEFYPMDFSSNDLLYLGDELDSYIYDMRHDDEFLGLKGIGALAEKMISKKKDILYPLVYLLIKLVLTLPIATATVERCFSAMNIVKTKLRNRMDDHWMNDTLITYIENDVFDSVSDMVIMQRFQNMKPRRGQL